VLYLKPGAFTKVLAVVLAAGSVLNRNFTAQVSQGSVSKKGEERAQASSDNTSVHSTVLIWAPKRPDFYRLIYHKAHADVHHSSMLFPLPLPCMLLV
jgi:hypothetical protein